MEISGVIFSLNCECYQIRGQSEMLSIREDSVRQQLLCAWFIILNVV